MSSKTGSGIVQEMKAITSAGMSRCSTTASPGGTNSSRSSRESTQESQCTSGKPQRSRRRKAATNLKDLKLLTCFLGLCGLPDVASETAKLMLRAIDLLYRCRYPSEDICAILAYGSAYFSQTHKLCGANMNTEEVGNFLVLMLFIAHSYLLDHTCPLRVWHSELFNKYCSVKVLDAAIIRVLELRNYVLRVKDDDFLPRYESLRGEVIA
eukprot:TRINITY_DN67690_c0_g1_i1.p1 TRINITY_DN67690_c0_g1~~TRINITY_DN67690_c0_g1_i1.p1  ORF type:complete len:210 (+),score=22.08 TRINITY_DN67690_c0_g1_i1:72-701(+)